MLQSIEKIDSIFKFPEMFLEAIPVESPIIHIKMAVFLPRILPNLNGSPYFYEQANK